VEFGLVGALPGSGHDIPACAILTVAFALLEVSDNLIVAREEKFFPIAWEISW